MTVTSLSTKGQIVIPKRIREALGLRPGTKIIVELEDGKVVLKPVKEGIGNRLYGKYKGLDLLRDLENEHGREIARDKERE